MTDSLFNDEQTRLKSSGYYGLIDIIPDDELEELDTPGAETSFNRPFSWFCLELPSPLEEEQEDGGEVGLGPSRL